MDGSSVQLAGAVTYVLTAQEVFLMTLAWLGKSLFWTERFHGHLCDLRYMRDLIWQIFRKEVYEHSTAVVTQGYLEDGASNYFQSLWWSCSAPPGLLPGHRIYLTPKLLCLHPCFCTHRSWYWESPTFPTFSWYRWEMWLPISVYQDQEPRWDFSWRTLSAYWWLLWTTRSPVELPLGDSS